MPLRKKNKEKKTFFPTAKVTNAIKLEGGQGGLGHNSTDICVASLTLYRNSYLSGMNVLGSGNLTGSRIAPSRLKWTGVPAGRWYSSTRVSREAIRIPPINGGYILK